MTNGPEDLHGWTGAYVLGALPADERSRFEAHLEACASCSREVGELRATTARLGALADESPPAGLREQILRAAAVTPQEASTRQVGAPQQAGAPQEDGAPQVAGGVQDVRPTGAGAPRIRRAISSGAVRDRRAGPWWTSRWLAAAAVFLVVAMVGVGYLVTDLADRLEEAQTVAQQARRDAEQFTDLLAAPDASLLTANTAEGGLSRVVLSRSRGEAVIVTEGLQPTPTDHTYQLWLIDDDGPTPAGLFEPGADGRATHAFSGELSGEVVIGVTVEPSGGSPLPTTDPVLAIEVGDVAEG